MAAHRKRRKKQGVIALAMQSDWRLSAFLSACCLFAGTVVLPSYAAGHPLLQPIFNMLALPAWVLAFLFAAIAVIRFLGRPSASAGGADALSAGASFRDQTQARPPVSAGGGSAGGKTTAELGRAASAPAEGPVAEPPPERPPRPTAWSLAVLDQVEWKRFEDLCCAFYREKGIAARTTVLGADGGVDIRLFQDDADASRATAVVQCKALSRPVGVATVRELRGVMAHEKVDKGFFMAPRGFSPEARAFAAENRITLVDGRLFLAMLQRLPEKASARLLALATEGDWTTPSCPQCGDKMIARESARGAFWGCRRFPGCRGRLPMRRLVQEETV